MKLGLGCASDRRDYHSKGMCLMMRARPARARSSWTPRAFALRPSRSVSDCDSGDAAHRTDDGNCV